MIERVEDKPKCQKKNEDGILDKVRQEVHPQCFFLKLFAYTLKNKISSILLEIRYFRFIN